MAGPAVRGRAFRLAALNAADGTYWVRVAFVDLLDNQKPFKRARPYRFQR